MADAATLEITRDPLSELVSKASGRKDPRCSYAGELTPIETFEHLVKEGGMLVDVRTIPEWQFVGVPDLSGCKGDFAAISWKVYPDMSQNAVFAEQLAATGVNKDSAIFFICRGGGRSSSAAQAMSELGYTRCFNVATGFEGAADEQGHRGRVSGWQGSGLPWKH